MRGLRRHRRKLKRRVAVKVLATAFTADPERLARFEREAQPRIDVILHWTQHLLEGAR